MSGVRRRAGRRRPRPPHAEEFERLQRLNSAYREKFGFPFLFAVKGSTKHDILRALERRLSNDPAAEHARRLPRFTASPESVSRKRFMEQFASGWKRSYYGKGDVIVYRLNRDGRRRRAQLPVFGANVTMLIYGDAFWPTYTTGDNTGLIATDSMKNFIQRETLNFTGYDLEAYCRFLGAQFLETYPQVEGIQISRDEIPYLPIVEGAWRLRPPVPSAPPPRWNCGATARRWKRWNCAAAFRASGCCASAAARSTASCATNTPRCPTCTIVRCTCGSTWNGSTPSPPPGTQQGRGHGAGAARSCTRSSRGSSPAASSR